MFGMMLGAAVFVLFLFSMSVSNALETNALPMPQHWPGERSSFPINQHQNHVGQGVHNVQQVLPEDEQTSNQVPGASGTSQRCEVGESSRVRCGEVGIDPAACEALNCCYDPRRFILPYYGPMCYYAKAVTVQCTKDGQFVVVVARDSTVPRVAPESISLLGATHTAGSSCTPVDGNADFTIWQFSVTSCGTRMKMEGSDVIYENMMVSLFEVGVGARGMITRDSSFVLTFQCKYRATAVADLVMDVRTVPPPLPVSQLGPLRVELRLANGECTTKRCSDADRYGSYYTEADYPVTKVLRDPLFVEVRLVERTDPNIALVLNQCWATSSPDPSSNPQWDLLVDGCPFKDDKYLVSLVPVSSYSGVQYPTHYKRFVVKMFAFVEENTLLPLQEQVFIHCSTAVCQISATQTCTPNCGRRKRAVSRPLDPEVLVSSNEVLLVGYSPVSAEHQAKCEREVSDVFTYGLTGAALAVMGICGLLAAVYIRRLKPSCLHTTTQ
ncbi:zona pellucida glycoprotein 2, like 2 [Brachyhypopomus gauderio]|uniref:zona pellucida glycoprotein 2, like 2 n=1 Tax=Brachyhypopomus gauderio TaxID=698409 RepID=UPI0040413F25